MDYSRLSLFFFAATIYIALRSIYRLYFHPLHNIPGPKLAIITHLYEFYYDIVLGGSYLFEIEKMHEKYGPIVRINPREIHISDPQFYDEIYAAGARRRNKDAATASFSGMLLSTIATVDHDLHRSRRKLTENFFSKQFIYRFSHMVDAKVQKLMQRLEGFYKSGKVVQMDDAFSALTSDVITHYCYGKSWDYLDDENLRNDVRKAVGDITGIIHVNRIFPIFISTIRKLPLSLFYLLQPGKRGLLDMQKAIYEQSNQAIQKDEPSENKRKTIYDQLTDPSVPLEERSLQRLQDEGLLLLSAGTETTARALTMASFHIANDAEVRNQLRAELKRVMPTPTSTVTWTELEKLPYLTGTVYESLRLGGFLTLRSARVAPTETLTYNGHVIPPGTPMSSSSYFIHKDPSIFPEPEKFSPARWILNGETNTSLTKYITSFTRGSRICLGMHLAYSELYLTLAYYVRRFDIELHNTTLEDLKIQRDYGVGITHRGDPSVHAKIVKVIQD